MNRLAVFARPPVAGRVKTRLSPSLPPALAAELYAALLSDTLDAARGCTAAGRTLWWAEERAGSPAPEGFVERMQSGDDLGERMSRAFEALLASPGERVVLIGSDLPAITAAHLDRAFEALEREAFVLGPTLDGGYWLIGLSRREPSLFAGVPWGTDAVLSRTREAAKRAGLGLHELETMADLDTPADLVRLVAEAAGGKPAFGPSALAALRRMGLLPG